ncbi:MAG: molybdopterin molybdenumtransferase MoeA, partial [Planctomycetia bacterium]
CELLVRPALAILGGRPRGDWHLPRRKAVLAAPVKAAADRPVYLPCRLAEGETGLVATPLPWTGSSDLLGLAGAGGLIALPADARRHDAGEPVEVVLR